ncbi:MAG: 3-oxoacyl-[acyl-carrier-protein] synthase III C-terminal domain-containing protein [Thermodesulfobacteriota bacterium]
MAGIISAAAHIPYLKMERKVIGGAWERGSLPGCRSVAGSDEDSLTMAAEAATACLGQTDRGSLDGVFFASTTAPYREKQSASLLATVLDLRVEVQTVDFGNSLRSGLSALRLALDSVAGGAAGSLLVTSGEQRLGFPRSDQEQLFGDAGAAVLVGGDQASVAYLGGFRVSDEITDVWRMEQDRYVRTWEGRFVSGEGYLAVMTKAVKGLLAKLGLKPGDIAKAVIPAPEARALQDLLKKTGLTGEGQAAQPLLDQVGFCGAAQPLLMLAAALEQAQPGQKILLAAYGDGAEALLFEVRGAVAKPASDLAGQLANRRALNSYARFLSFRDTVEPLPGEPFRLVPSATVTWRERDSLLRCQGSKCRVCGTVAYPIQRVCDHCRSIDQFDTVRLSGLSGEVFTFSRDNLAGRSDDPVVVQTVVQMENGARFYGLMTDCDPSQVDLGLPVRLTLRRFHDLGGFHNYFWKCRPVR